jgi:hypothetical protein
MPWSPRRRTLDSGGRSVGVGPKAQQPAPPDSGLSLSGASGGWRIILTGLSSSWPRRALSCTTNGQRAGCSDGWRLRAQGARVDADGLGGSLDGGASGESSLDLVGALRRQDTRTSHADILSNARRFVLSAETGDPASTLGGGVLSDPSVKARSPTVCSRWVTSAPRGGGCPPPSTKRRRSLARSPQTKIGEGEPALALPLPTATGVLTPGRSVSPWVGGPASPSPSPWLTRSAPASRRDYGGSWPRSRTRPRPPRGRRLASGLRGSRLGRCGCELSSSQCSLRRRLQRAVAGHPHLPRRQQARDQSRRRRPPRSIRCRWTCKEHGFSRRQPPRIPSVSISVRLRTRRPGGAAERSRRRVTC